MILPKYNTVLINAPMKKLRFSIILILLIFSSLYISLPNAFSYTTGQSLAIVLGQIDFTSGSSNQGGSAAANTLSTPYSIATDGTRLAVADYNNNRVLLFNSIPTATNSSPDVVLGQSTFTGTSINAGGRSASSLNKPSGVAFAGNKLIVLDANNCRALVWNSFPTTNKQAADVVIGAPNFSTVDCDHTQTAFAGWKIYYDSVTGKLFIADYDYYRILIFNSVPTSNGAAADVVIGQTNFTSTTGGTSATKISGPTGIVVVNGKLLIVDRNHRVVIFNSIPTTNGAAADLVIGQQNLTGNSADQGALLVLILLISPMILPMMVRNCTSLILIIIVYLYTILCQPSIMHLRMP